MYADLLLQVLSTFRRLTIIMEIPTFVEADPKNLIIGTFVPISQVITLLVKVNNKTQPTLNISILHYPCLPYIIKY